MTNTEGVIARARMFRFVREAPGNANAGRWVEAIQRIGGTSRGNPWCACFVSLALGIWYDGAPPLPFTASCDVLLEAGRKAGVLFTEPQVGDIFLVLKSPHDAVHTGFVTAVTGTTFSTIEGNASDPQKPATREGWGVFERTRPRNPKYVFLRYTLIK